jgi:hypothetical protein
MSSISARAESAMSVGGPQVQIVLPARSRSQLTRGAGTKLFVHGKPVERVAKIEHGSGISPEGAISSFVTIHLHEPIEVTFAPDE